MENITIYDNTEGKVVIEKTSIVKLTNILVLSTEDKEIPIKITISTDIGTIPEEYHEVLINMLTTKYHNKVVLGKNPFSQHIIDDTFTLKSFIRKIREKFN